MSDTNDLQFWPHAVAGIAAASLGLLAFNRARASSRPLQQLRVASWNIAAINNNPFEYWITHKDPGYNKLMRSVQDFINTPGSGDVEVSSIFTQSMFEDLKTDMLAAGWSGVDQVEEVWQEDYSKRKIISQFLKDGKLGKKRLASMPDRITNTINLADGSTVFRPTVINCYEGDLGSTGKWWNQWRTFMFQTPLSVRGKGGAVKTQKAFELLPTIKHAKYPDITPEEEKISIPLQSLACAIFDCIMVHMLNTVDRDNWQQLRSELCLALNKNKVPRTLDILSTQYGDADVLFLQEVSSAFAAQAQAVLGDRFDVHLPGDMDAVRDQNSLILTNKRTFGTSASDVSSLTKEKLKAKFPDAPMAKGDLFVLEARDTYGEAYLLASFHGDTNGLATVPVTTAVRDTYTAAYPNHRLIFGLDANTYDIQDNKKWQNVNEYADSLTSMGLTSCWGPKPDITKITTFNARTFLQAQLNKAVKFSEKDVKGDRNLKDFIVFDGKHFTSVDTARDNTGSGSYVEDMVIPSLGFPSDHCILATTLMLK